MKKFIRHAVSGICIALTCTLLVPTVAIKLQTKESKAEKFVAYAALSNRLDTLGGTIVHKNSYDDTIKEAEEKKKKYEAQKSKLQNELSALKTEYDDITAYIEEMDLKQNDIMLEMAEIMTQIDEANAELEITKANLAEAEAIADKQYETMKKRLQYIYENGETSYLEIVLNSKSLADLLNQVEYVDKITEYDNNLLNRYIDAKNEVSEYEKFLEAQIESLNISQNMYQADADYAEGVIAAKQVAMADYEAKIGTNEEILEEYIDKIAKQEMTIQEAEAAQQKLIEEAKKQEAQSNASSDYSKVPSTGYSNAAGITLSGTTDPANMIWPLPGDSYVGDGFGPRIPPVAGASSFHKGVDIGGSVGAQIVAALAGTVTEAKYNSTGGYHVYIDHGNGYLTRYLHCSKLLVSAGDYVQQGQVIALCGSTGVSTGAHLHFSVYISGTPVDPLKYIKY